MKVKNILLIYFIISFFNCQAQKNIVNHQPPTFKEEEIKMLYNSYVDKAIDITSYLPRNYKIDGSIDYTTYLQKALDENRIVLLPNFPILINDRGLKMKSNTVLLFNNKTKLILKPSKKDTYNIIEIHKVKNIEIFNAEITGDINTHIGKSGEWGMGIAIRSSENISIYNPKIENCWGDGIYVGQILSKTKESKTILEPVSKNINIYNAYINGCGRNGLSLVAVDGIRVYNSLFANSKRTFPKSGIDIEPGPGVTTNIEIINCSTFNNGARGIDLFFRTIAKTKRNAVSAKIINYKDIGSPIGIRIAGYKDRSNLNVVQGTIEIINPTLLDNRMKEIDIETDQRYAPEILIKNYKGKQDVKKTIEKVGAENRIKVLR